MDEGDGRPGTGGDGSGGQGRPPGRGAARGTMFVAMRSLSYRWLWSTTLSSSSGRYAVMMVAGWLAFRLTGSAVGAGLSAFFAFAPALLVGPFAGAMADRVDRRRLIQAGSIVAGSCCVLVAALAAAGRLDLDLVLLVPLAAGVGVALEQPSRVSLISAVSAPEDLLNAFSLIRIPMQGAEMVGPALATAALVRLGPAAALLVCAGLYLLAVLQAPYVAPPEVARRRQEGQEHAPLAVVRSLREGLAYVRGERQLGALLVWVWLH